MQGTLDLPILKILALEPSHGWAMLFDVRPLDLAVYLAVAALVGVVTVLASYVPARRAASSIRSRC